MPKLTITQDCEGSPDGIAIAEYKAGEIHNITPHLAPILIAAGWATLADEAPKPTPIQEAPVIQTPETKAAPAAPENKAHTPKAETKGGKGKGK